MSSTEKTIGHVREVNITAEMQVAYLDYAMSVIVARALPDVRDGLKPVHRRILYAMHAMGLMSTKPYKKSARIVGEVLGKYHPHSDTSVYDAMVRMAQDFSLRYPLVDGQGNFGSIDGDNAAAMRYTEARLAAISDLMLLDIEKDTINWHDNFDNTLQEPDILPAALPNLLINGANGIAVGMATNIPPHNLGEIIDATVYLIDNFERIEEIVTGDLMQFVKGPDFPTGGILFRYRQGSKGEENIDVISQGYATGRGRLVLQAKAHFEELSRGRSRIVVTSLPYQTNKTNLLERIALLVRDGKVEGITDLRDESDRTGMRIVIDLTRNVEQKAVLADLLRLTPMQQTFGMSMLALVDGQPRTLSLKRFLHLFIEHRQEIVRRRLEFDLAKARARAHVVKGLLKALDILDEVIQTVRRSRRVETARMNLIRGFGFTEVQAQAILDMALKRLAALERRRLRDEENELKTLIVYLADLLENPHKMLDVIRDELLTLREQHMDSRRTQIIERTKDTLTSTDLLPDLQAWVALGANGELRRQAFAGISRTSLRQMGQNAAVALITANTRDHLFLFAKDGRCRRVEIHEIPQADQSNQGKHLATFTDYSRRDIISTMLALPRLTPDDANGYLFLVTQRASVKRVALPDFVRTAGSAPDVIRIHGKDGLGWAFVTPGNSAVLLVTRKGRSICFPEDTVRVMGLAAGGVSGMNLKQGDEIIAAMPVVANGELLTITSCGFAKRTSMTAFSRQGRNGSGIIAHKISTRTGELVSAAMLTPDHELVTFVTNKGVSKPLGLDSIPSSGRNTQGGQVVDIAQGDAVAAVQMISGVMSATDSPAVESLPSLDAHKNQHQTPRTTGQSKSANSQGRPKALPKIKGQTTEVTANKETKSENQLVQGQLDLNVQSEHRKPVETRRSKAKRTDKVTQVRSITPSQRNRKQ